MGELEKQEFERVVCSMTEEEQKITLKHIETDMLWDELRKRETSSRNIVKGIRDLVR